MKDTKPHFEHIISSMGNIQEFIRSTPDFEAFQKDLKTIRAIERELETMTQSIKDIGDEVYKISGNIDWKAIAGMRDILAHHYLVLADVIIWDVAKNKIPELDREFRRYLKM